MHPDKIATAFGSLADIKGANEFVTVNDGPSPEEEALQQENEQLKQQMQQMQQEQQQKMMDDKLAQIQSAQAATPTGVADKAGLFQNPDIAQVADMITGTDSFLPDNTTERCRGGVGCRAFCRRLASCQQSHR